MKNHYKKLVFLFAIFFITISLIPALASKLFQKEEFMKLEDAQKKWGTIQFDAEKFKEGDGKIRASMAASLIKSKEFIGNPIGDVRRKLGTPTGYYFSDMIPAYAIGDLSWERTETWQIIFMPDNDSKIIREIKIHKKCCYK